MSEFKSWDELSPLEQAQATYWDFFKEAYGYRPRGIDTSSWTLEDFDREFEVLSGTCTQARLSEEAAEQEAIQKFEACIATLLTNGARDRETAIRWVAESFDAGQDREYLCFQLGIPYGYFKEVEMQ